MSVFAESVVAEMLRVLHRAVESGRADVESAAQLVVDCIRSDGIIQVYGAGHSQSTALELAGRAGGFVPTNRISIADLVLFGGQSPRVLDDPLLERADEVAPRLYELAAPQPPDLFVIASNSGVNKSVVEMALIAKSHGHQLVAITSVEHSLNVPPMHHSGKRLLDVADVTLDNCAPLGDTIAPIPNSSDSIGGVSSLTGALLVQLVVAEAVVRLIDDGVDPPLYRSANVPGGYERNLVLEDRYKGRIRRIAS
jgi:uncharacterized phosphosugar-binding protein